MAKNITTSTAAPTEPKPEPITPEDFRKLAEAVKRIQEAAKAMMSAGLHQKAIVILLSHSTGVSQREVSEVLYGLRTLADKYCTK
jgi:hypothetical protein